MARSSGNFSAVFIEQISRNETLKGTPIYCTLYIRIIAIFENTKFEGMRTFLLFSALIILCSCGENSPANESDSSKQDEPVVPIEEHDIISAEEVEIGQQIWMTHNLSASSFQNGDKLLETKTADEWHDAYLSSTPAYCSVDFDPANDERYGKLYNYHAVQDPRGIAPTGWHVPSMEEWYALIDFNGGSESAIERLGSEFDWNDKDMKRTNASGFTALPAGQIVSTGELNAKGDVALFWSSTKFKEHDYTYSPNRTMITMSYTVDGGWGYGSANALGCGYSIRCIKDSTIEMDSSQEIQGE